MQILVSFCNVKPTERPSLGLLDTDKFALRILQPLNKPLRNGGITGLAVSEYYVYVALQTRPTSGLLILRRTDLTQVNYYVFQSVVDVHSLWFSDNFLYVVSTGTDEIIKLKMQNSEVVSEDIFWHLEPRCPREDTHHLNGICGWHGDLIVSGLGKKHHQGWSSSTNGFIINISRNEILASGIRHPHSLAVNGDTIVYCESPKNSVRILGETQINNQLTGYTRGLCIVGNKLFIGTSKGRKVSKSTGRINTLDNSGVFYGDCTISRLSLESLETEDTLNLNSLGTVTEIYDLLPVETCDEREVRF